MSNSGAGRSRSEQLDEAAATTLDAVTSGRLVPSNYWRAREVIAIIASRRLPEAPALQEAYRQYCRDKETPTH